jgi:hypothetical protein
MCQKAFGSFFGPLVSVPPGALRWTRGALAVFRSSELAERGFCRDCGTPLTFRYLDDDGIDVSIGSLDRPEQAKPVLQFRLESRLPWLDEIVRLPVREDAGEETGEKLAAIARTNRQHPDHDTDVWPPETQTR